MDASNDCIRFLLKQCLAFCRHYVSKSSNNQKKILQLLLLLCDHHKGIKFISLKNYPKNHKLTSLEIQKDILNAISIEITNVIFVYIENSQFFIFIDKFNDSTSKEQIIIVIRYVDKMLCD